MIAAAREASAGDRAAEVARAARVTGSAREASAKTSPAAGFAGMPSTDSDGDEPPRPEPRPREREWIRSQSRGQSRSRSQSREDDPSPTSPAQTVLVHLRDPVRTHCGLSHIRCNASTSENTMVFAYSFPVSISLRVIGSPAAHLSCLGDVTRYCDGAGCITAW